jgi:hypothetical protein
MHRTIIALAIKLALVASVQLALVLSASVGNAQSKDTKSANYMLQPCKDLLRPGTHASYLQGVCEGQVDGVSLHYPEYVSPLRQQSVKPFVLWFPILRHVRHERMKVSCS